MITARNVKQPPDPDRQHIKFNVTEALETDAAVLSLEWKLHAVTVECYLRGGTPEQRARALRCHVSTMYRRLERAHGELLGLFNDIAAGVELPLPEWRMQGSGR